MVSRTPPPPGKRTAAATAQPEQVTARDPAAFAAALRRFRNAARLTQEALAHDAGLSVEAISALERGTRSQPREATVACLADALSLSVRDRVAFQALAGYEPIDEKAPIGRERQRAWLRRHLSGEKPLIMVSGKPGLGKSHLLGAMGQWASACGWKVFTGACLHGSASGPYAPLTGVIKRSLRSLPDSRKATYLRGCAWLVRLLPELLDDGILVAPRQTLGADQEQRLMFEAIERYFENVSEGAGTLLVLDDLQWAGQDAVRLLTHLIRGSQTGQVRILAAVRSTEMAHRQPLAALVANLAQDDLVARVDLAPLASADATRLANTVLHPLLTDGDKRAGRQLVQRLASRAEGVPLFILQLARALRDLAAEREASGISPASSCGASEDRPRGMRIEISDLNQIPWTIADHVHQRVAALPSSAQALFEVLALAENATSSELLAACVGRSESEVLHDLDAGCLSGLLESRQGRSGRVRFRFAHELLREVVDEGLSPGRRMLVHRALGGALEKQVRDQRRRHEDLVPRLAYHYARSGQPEKAADHLRRAGDQARRMYAHEQAAVCYAELVTVLADLRQGREAAAARRDLADERASLGRYAEALDALTRARVTYRALGEVEQAALVTATIASVHASRGTVDAGLAELRPLVERIAMRDAMMDAMRDAGEPGRDSALSPEVRALVHATFAHLSFMDGRYEEALLAAERSLKVARVTGDEALIGRARLQMGVALLTLGLTTEAANSLNEAKVCAQRAGRRDLEVEALLMLIWTHQTRGDFAIAHDLQCQAVNAAQELGNPTSVGHAFFLQGLLAYYMGHWDTARGLADSAAGQLGKLDSSPLGAYPPLGFGWLLLVTGHRTEAMRRLEEARAIALRSDGEQVVRLIEELLAEDELVRDQGRAAYDRLTPLLGSGQLQERTRIELQTLRAWALLCMEQTGEAEALALDAVHSAREHAMTLLLPDALRVLALCAIARGDREVAREALATALVICKAMPYPYAEAKVRYVYGLFCFAMDETEHAHEQLKQALAICGSLGERMYATVIEQALEQERKVSTAG